MKKKKTRKETKRGAHEERRCAPPGKTPREDTASVMRFYGIKDAFPKGVRAETAAIASGKKALADELPRKDLRKKFVFTCDPVTARDYDDALSLGKDTLGRRVLGVHIADVSHYVRPGSELDREARRRSTSVYFADKVVPMLPNELSNGLCSLVPGEDRLAFSVFITFDKAGKAIKSEFAKSIIRSKARYTYEQVMAAISAGGKRSAKCAIPAKERKTICAISELAMQLRAARFADGALDIEVPEAEIELDDSGEMTGVATRDYDESHQMIEECMVAANEAVAKELWSHKVKVLARFHDAPDELKLEELRAGAAAMGLKCGNLAEKKPFMRFLEAVKRHPAAGTLSMMILRSMQRAVYDSSNMGHWGLAKRFYAHFTSPIRRYPDLTLHRQLAAYLAAKGNPAKARIAPDELAKLAEHCTAMEQRATEAERSLAEIKKYRLLEEELASRVRVDYDAVIASCEPFGCFVDVPALAVSGLVHISRLSRGYVRYNPSDRTLRAHGGAVWNVGDRMKVHVTRVDFLNRKLDFEPSTGNKKENRWNSRSS